MAYLVRFVIIYLLEVYLMIDTDEYAGVNTNFNLIYYFVVVDVVWIRISSIYHSTEVHLPINLLSLLSHEFHIYSYHFLLGVRMEEKYICYV